MGDGGVKGASGAPTSVGNNDKQEENKSGTSDGSRVLCQCSKSGKYPGTALTIQVPKEEERAQRGARRRWALQDSEGSE
jgi:hypothetical protein